MIDTSALPMKVEYVGKTKRDDWDCFEWRVTFSSVKNGFWTLPYYCGLGHVEKPKHSRRNSMSYVEKPKRPSNDDILHSLILDASAAGMNFHDWCTEYGYSDDSISALTTYKQCLDIATHLRKHLGHETLTELEKQLQDH